MGVGKRTFTTFLCDGCGREVIAEEDATVDGYFIEVMQVQNGNQLGSENVFACCIMCVERAVHDSLYRESLPEPDKLTATQELWLRGRASLSNPELPVYDARDETRVIGTAREIERYSEKATDPLDPDWKPSPMPTRRTQ